MPVSFSQESDYIVNESPDFTNIKFEDYPLDWKEYKTPIKYIYPGKNKHMLKLKAIHSLKPILLRLITRIRTIV